MNELVFVGLGLYDENGITLKGLKEAKNADAVFIETYTSLMPNFSLQRFEAICGKRIQILSRRELEEESGKVILETAKHAKAVFLVPGDPFIATTHVTLRIDAQKQGIKTRIVHGTSIISAIVSLSGLHNYKFGKTVTVPFSDNFSETPYNVIAQNKSLGLHTLCLLDLKAAEERYLTINEAIRMLLEVEQKIGKRVVTKNTVALAVARAGANNPLLKADFAGELVNFEFGEPPFSLIFPGDLHFMEIESLIAFADGPGALRRLAK